MSFFDHTAAVTAGSRVWEVGALCRAIADSLEARFDPVSVRGEITGFSRAGSGHCYFNIKDAAGQLRCAMFRRAAMALDFMPRDGELVEVRGKLGVYEQRGDLQLIVDSLQRAGQGAWFEQFLRLKAQLEAEGLFDAQRKRALPVMPKGIGVVTSLGAAALHDVATALRRRVPHIPVLIVPSLVQGAEAPASIVQALQQLYALAQRKGEPGVPDIDVILLVRGGGSMEDLWCFNSPQVVQAIYDAQVPVITAIGHETDTTLADYAADVRAATPTHAAELAFPDFEEIQMDLAAMADQAYQSVVQRLDRLERELGRTVAALQTRRYDDFLTMKDESVSQLVRLARQHLDLKLTRETGRLQALKASLSAMNPALLVRKGYGQLEQDGHVLTDMKLLRQERPLTKIKEVTIHGSDKRKTKKL